MSELIKQDSLIVHVLGVRKPLVYTCSDPNPIVDSLLNYDESISWVSWETLCGLTVVLRPSFVSSVNAIWDPASRGSHEEFEAAARVWLKGRPKPLRFTFEESDERAANWPVPRELLFRDGQEWLMWRDEDGELVMIQSEHVVAMAYPTKWDTDAIEADIRADEPVSAR